MKSFLKEYKDELIFIGLLISMFLVLVVGALAEKKIDKKRYNNGICQNCGGHYEFLQIVGRKNSNNDTYVYKCNKCGKIIEVHDIMDK